MDPERFPPLVDIQQVRSFRDQLDAVANGIGFVILLNPIVDPRNVLPFEILIKKRLAFLLRLATYASYVLGEPVVKIANLGLPQPQDRTSREAAYLQIAATVAHLRMLAMGRSFSLVNIRKWDTCEGSDLVPEYETAVNGILNTVAFAKAAGVSIDWHFHEPELWYSSSDNLLDEAEAAPPSVDEGMILTGHLIESPDNPATWRELLRVENPISLHICNRQSADHAVSFLLSARSQTRPVILSVDREADWFSSVLSAAQQASVPFVVIARVDLSRFHSDEMSEDVLMDVMQLDSTLRCFGYRLGGIEFSVPAAGADLSLAFPSSFRVVESLLTRFLANTTPSYPLRNADVPG